MILVDTNLLCRLVHRAHSDHAVARLALKKLRLRGEPLMIAPQSLYEFWSVATRPPGRPPGGSNGLGLSPDLANQWLDYLQRRFDVLSESERIIPIWRALVHTLPITGHKCHDARIAAIAQVHGITDVLTFNGKDFGRFTFLKVIDPRLV